MEEREEEEGERRRGERRAEKVYIAWENRRKRKFDQFVQFGDSCTSIPWLIRAKFGVRE